MNVMKTLKTFILVLGTILLSTSLYSCLDDDDYSLDKYSVGVATIKPLGGNTYYLQWDDSTTFWPAAGATPYFGVDKERRVFINFTLLGDSTSGGIKGYDYAIRVNRIDSVLTKSIVADLGEKNDEYYGNDPVWMKSVWIEDGYINFQFESYFDGYTKHFLNLVKMDNTDTYELEFRHNAYDNLSGGKGWGLASFRLNNLPETNGETVTMKIKYKSYEGDKTIELKYKSGSPAGKAPMMGEENFHSTN
ncbi:hypothetical protein DXD68_08090 [Parabacteroides sp. TM07-1AC]|uniref:NigD-like protein n=1 Tax=Parabacteroides sp. TM07-1AC TaxID=2292363 RepID=UPI000EFEA163|nr:NigD-like protein [Parabacteroides sp. TM07-1AC]RHU27864.1 hypothetical protein DXD68_08090 [Parabacteroides sp. TM07-1AC]